MKTWRAIIIVVMMCATLSARSQMVGGLSYRHYTIGDGLPQLQTERLWQDSRGYIYIGTLSGFVRFDGKDFTAFLKGRRENIVAFSERDGEVTAWGFRRQWRVGVDDVKRRQVITDGSLLLNNLNAGSLPDGYVLLEDEQETHRALCRLTAKEPVTVFKSTLLDDMEPDRKLYIDSALTMIPTRGGLYRIDSGSRRATRVSGKSDIFTVARTDTALLAFAADGIYAIDNNGLRQVATVDWSATAFGLTVRPRQGGGLIIADEHSVYLYYDNSVMRLITGINLIRDVLVDRWNRLWVATYEGVYCYFNCCFTNYKPLDDNDIVRGLAAIGDGRLAMGTLNGKVMLMDATRAFTTLSDNASQYYGTSTVAIGNRAFITDNGNVAEITGYTIRDLALPPGNYRFLSRLAYRLVIGNDDFLLTYDPATDHVDTLSTEVPHPWCAAADARGNLWVGGTMGLFKVTTDRRVTPVDYPHKLVITVMTADDRGTVFFASGDSLFMVGDDAKVVTLNDRIKEVAQHEIRSIHVSPRGYLVVAVIDGLFVCRLDKDYRLSDIHFFDQRNGFTLLEPLRAPMAETDDGLIWLADVKQITSFDPEQLLSLNEDDTYIGPPLKWWQHWWVWVLTLAAFTLAVWGLAHWVEKRRNRRNVVRLQREKRSQERRIEAIRRKAIEAESTALTADIVKLTERNGSDRVTLRTATGTRVVELKDIAYFKGDGNYSLMVTFHSRDTVLIGLGALEKILDPDTFVRADRSTLVNVNNISNLLPKQRRCVFRSTDGQEEETTLLAPAFKRLQELL